MTFKELKNFNYTDDDQLYIYKPYLTIYEWMTARNGTDLKITFYEMKETEQIKRLEIKYSKTITINKNKVVLMILEEPANADLTRLQAINNFIINKHYNCDMEHAKQYAADNKKNAELYYIQNHNRTMADEQKKQERDIINYAIKQTKAKASLYAYCLSFKSVSTQELIYKAIADELITLEKWEQYESKATNQKEINTLLIADIRAVRQTGREASPQYLDKVLENTRRKWARKLYFREEYQKLYDEFLKKNTPEQAKALTMAEMKRRQDYNKANKGAHDPKAAADNSAERTAAKQNTKKARTKK